MPHDVFISYSSKDATIADGVRARLEAHGLTCWIAPRDIAPGQSYAGALLAAIQASRVVVVVFSNHSNLSPHVANEVDAAFNAGKIIIPFRIQDLVPSADLGYYLRRCHWLDAWTPPLETHLQKLAETISAWLSGAAPAPKAAPAPAEPAADAPNTISTYIKRTRIECADRFTSDLLRPDRLYVPQYASHGDGGGEVALGELMEKFWGGPARRVAVLGNYGMGKSYFTWRAVLDQLSRTGGAFEPMLPVLYPLRNFNYSLSVPQAGREQDAKDIVAQVLEHAMALDFPRVDRRQFVRWIEDGVVGVLLDGLDELSLPRQASWTEVLAPMLEIRGARILVTSRPAFLSDPQRELAGFEVFELLAWGEREWEAYLDRSEEALARAGGKEAFAATIAGKPKLASLTSRPLWCYMIVSVAEEVAGLADLALSGLYQKFLDAAVRRRPLMDAVLTLAWQYCALESFAAECVRRRVNALDEENFLTLLSGLFESVGHQRLRQYLTQQIRTYAFLNCDRSRRYHFGHASFEDYFLAAHAARWLGDAVLESESAPPQLVPREPLLHVHRLSEDQAGFLAGIVQEGWILESLEIAAKGAGAKLTSRLLLYLQRELADPHHPAILRTNLFRLYVDLLRAVEGHGTLRLSGLCLKGAVLSGVRFDDCILERVDFTSAVLSRASFRRARLAGATFFGAALDGADFTGADVSGADFVGMEPPEERLILAGVTGMERARTTPRELKLLA
jgi:hypothetical protein